MSSEVDICNLALSLLGDAATVSSIYPSEGSAQAEHCAHFYPIARDLLLSTPPPWNFATTRTRLAKLSTSDTWEYAHAYALPSEFISAVHVFTSEGEQAPQAYIIETLSTGERAIFTDCDGAVLRFVRRVTDTQQFPPLFVTALAWQLAALLAGALYKGGDGAALVQRCLQMVAVFAGQAAVADARQQRVKNDYEPPWIKAMR